MVTGGRKGSERVFPLHWLRKTLRQGPLPSCCGFSFQLEMTWLDQAESHSLLGGTAGSAGGRKSKLRASPKELSGTAEKDTFFLAWKVAEVCGTCLEMLVLCFSTSPESAAQVERHRPER